MATAPTRTAVTGVELDPVTARLADRLHQTHTVLQGDLVAADVSGFTAAVGNVPFGAGKPFDPELNPDRLLPIHNLSILKALNSVEVGAPVAVITSSWTLDAQTTAQRERLASVGEFIGAVRLPTETFETQASTSVSTDVLVFRRTAPGAEPSVEGWGNVAEIDVGDTKLLMNQWFIDHSEMVAGEIQPGGLYDKTQAVATIGTQTLQDRLDGSFEALNQHIKQTNISFKISPGQVPAVGRELATPDGQRPEWIKPGGLWRDDAAVVWQRPDNAYGPDRVFTPKPVKDARVLNEMIDLRDTYMQLVAAEASNADPVEIEKLRAALNVSYDAATRNGPINQFATTVNRNGVESSRRPPFGGFRLQDPDFGTVAGLENFDPVTQTADKASIFVQRQLNPNTRTVQVDTIDAAIAQSIHTVGELNPDLVAETLSINQSDLDEQLATAAFKQPPTETINGDTISGDVWVDKASYLSGNIRTKLAEAEKAAETDPTFQRNVDALTKALPEQLAIDDIDTQLGVTWIKPEEIEQFLKETFNSSLPGLGIRHSPAGGWAIDLGELKSSTSESLSQTWGTKRLNGLRIAEKGLRNETIKLFDTIETPDGGKTRIINHEATIEATLKLEELNLAFGDWLADPARKASMEDRYNHIFRSTVAPTYDGDWPRPEGLADHITLRPHQNAAIKRHVMTQSTGLYHEVGAGKTLAMAAANMEMKRLGLAAKPMMVVPKHLLTQVAGEFQQAFPTARLLVPDANTPKDRARFISQCAASDWDCVIITGNMFESIPVTSEAEASYIDSRTADLRETLTDLKTEKGNTFSVKRIESRVEAAENQLEDLRKKPRDQSLCFEQLGVDALTLDEAHYYKNLAVLSASPDFASKGSNRARDLDLKLGLLRETNPNTPIMLATGTPITNSFHEMWVMMRYTDPETLTKTGVDNFDSFVAQFGKKVTNFEPGPTGYKAKERLAEFRNVPELQNMFNISSDVKQTADLGLNLPTLKEGKPQPLIVKPSAQLHDYIEELRDRANNMPTDPKIDNHLKIYGDFAKVSLDLSLVDRASPASTKITVTADAIAERYHTNKNRRYLDPATKTEHPTPGSLQIVFMDQGVPDSKVDLYEKLRTTLTNQGVPKNQIAFVHETKNLKALYNQARTGQISVLVGSTAKMGTGMNVQTRAIALYHMDPPWRPSDLDQRTGRIIRQGNQNPEIEVFNVLAEKSGDSLRYSALTRKARMIGQVLNGSNTQRRVESTAPAEFSLAEFEAISSGDTDAIELLQANKTFQELDLQRKSHERRQHRAATQLDTYDQTIAHLTTTKTEINQLLADLGPNPEIEVPGLQKNQTPNDAIKQRISPLRERAAPIGQTRNVTITATRTGRNQLIIQADRTRILEFDHAETAKANIVTRINNALTALPKRADTIDNRLARTYEDKTELANQIGKPFRKQPQWEQAQKTKTTIEQRLQTKPTQPDHNPKKPAPANLSTRLTATQKHQRRQQTQPTKDQRPNL